MYRNFISANQHLFIMKYICCLAIICLLLISCEPKFPIEVKQIESKEIVKILPCLESSPIKDSIIISIPTEFEMRINSSVRYITWHYISDENTLWNDVFDYQVYETTPIYQLEIFNFFVSRPTKFIKKERNHFISKTAAIALLKKYHINSSLNDLKCGDTIKLVSYDTFKNENQPMINAFRKINDSINFRVMRGDGSLYNLRKNINW